MCLVNLDHSKDHRIYGPGAEVSLDHLAPDMVERLVAQGYVRLVEQPAQAKAEAGEEPAPDNASYLHKRGR